MSLIARVLDIVINPCLVDGDSYSLQSRKLFVIAFAGIAFNALLLGLPITILNGIYDPTVGGYIAGACFLQVTMTSSIIPYLYLRITKTLPEWVPDFQMWSTLPITLAFSFFSHQGSVVVLNGVVSLVGVVLQVRGWFVMLLYSILIIIFHALINDFAEEIPILHETFYHTQILPCKCLYLLGTVVTPLLLLGLGLFYIMSRFSERMNQADAAIAMNLAIADKLRRYDTEGIAEILAANRGKVDEKLLGAFTAIQYNLQEYRPHIPDYVIAATTSEQTEDGSKGGVGDAFDEDEGDRSYNTSDSNRSSNRRHSHCKSNLGYSSTSVEVRSHENSSSLHHHSRHSTSGAPVGASVSGVEDHIPFIEFEDSNNGNSTPRLSINPGQLLSLMGPTATTNVLRGAYARRSTDVKVHSSKSADVEVYRHGGAAKTYTGQATTVFIRFIAGVCGSLQGCDGSVPRGSHTSTVVEYLGLGVEAAAKHSKLHGGAMQYMQGCGMMVSFNAASRVNAHESKACAFALGLKAEIDALPKSTLTMHATIVTTPVMSFFAGTGGQLMMTVLGGFMPIHTALHHYLSQTVGDDVSCVLVSKGTIPNVELHYESRILGVVGMSLNKKGVDHSRSIDIQADAIQLLCPRKTKESDEWMYELENQTSSHGFTKMIVDTATTGDLQAAMHIVTEHESAIHNDTLLSRCLHDRIESCIEDNTTFPLHTTPPTKMW